MPEDGADANDLDRIESLCREIVAGKDGADVAALAGELLQQVARTRKRLREQTQILDQIHESVITMDLDGYITSWNRGAERLFGYAAAEAVGRHILFLYADPDDPDDSDAGFQDAFLEHGGRELEVRRRRKSGDIFWASLQLSLLRDAADNPTGIIGYLTDITARVDAQETLRLHAHIFENSDEGILITDADERIVSVNQAFSRITGYDIEEAIGQTPRLLRSGRHESSFYDEVWQHIGGEGRWQGEIQDRRKNGEIFPTWVSISAVKNAAGKITHYFSIFSDITARKHAEERIHYLAYYDALTELPNRALFYKLVEQALAEARRNRQHGAILFIDLNRFKPINDTLGHGIGDRLLQQIGCRLRETLRTEDVVARLGGDEFVVALFDIAKRDHAGTVAQKLLASFDTPFVIDNHELKVGAALGISVYPQDGFDTETLLRLADIAMYRAKKTGEDGYAFFSHEMNQRALDHLKIESSLRHAIERDELLLHFQPKVDIASGRIVGAEALVRWRHPEQGMVPPGDFVHVAEETGLIVQISAWVLDAAIRQARAWQDAGLAPIKIAVNLSARDFSPALPERVGGILAAHGLAPEWLELEITESMLMHSTERVIGMMDELARAGIALALDDFGTGYSSLSYLKRFPIDTLKIDRSFVINIPADANDCAIAGAIVSMSKQLGHKVIAEGVETSEQLAFLASLGCDEFQGYLFSAPVPAEKFEAMLRQDKRQA
ncbi:MAG: diguanylate cyclase [Rhodocyclales bacterium GWA2_65_20]|nr:MAG: diguanylate cyclase [Rhodocyclales bacterium GWA2_65_20]